VHHLIDAAPAIAVTVTTVAVTIAIAVTRALVVIGPVAALITEIASHKLLSRNAES
jgi:hypothetical protein